MNFYIKDIQYFLPSCSINNISAAASLGKSEDFIKRKIGVEQRQRKKRHQNTSDLAVEALNKLLIENSLLPTFVDCLIVVTQTPDYQLPQTSSIVIEKAGLPQQIPNFDVSLGCSGFVYGLGLMKGFMASEGLSNGVLITAETYSEIVDENDANTSLLFSDGAAACLVSGDGFAKLGASTYGNDTRNYNALIVEKASGNLYMNGRAIYRMAMENVPFSIRSCLEKNNLDIHEIDRWYFHQGSRFVLDSICKELAIPDEKVPSNLTLVGNTTASSIPILIKEDEESLKMCRTVALAGFGVGLSWACTIMRLGESNEL